LGDALGLRFLVDTKKAAWIAAFYENRMAARAIGQSLSE